MMNSLVRRTEPSVSGDENKLLAITSANCLKANGEKSKVAAVPLGPSEQHSTLKMTF